MMVDPHAPSANASPADVFIRRGLTALFLGAIVWVSYLSISIVTNIDGTFDSMALRRAGTSAPRRLADHASSDGAALVHYRVLFTVVAVSLPLGAPIAFLLRSHCPLLLLGALLLTAIAIYGFANVAIITST